MNIRKPSPLLGEASGGGETASLDACLMYTHPMRRYVITRSMQSAVAMAPVLLLIAAMVAEIIVAGPPSTLASVLDDTSRTAPDNEWGMYALAALQSLLLLWLMIVITLVAASAVAVVLEVVSERVSGGWFRYLRDTFVLFGRSLPVPLVGIYLALFITVGLGASLRDAPVVVTALLRSTIPLIVFQSALLVWIMRPPPGAAPSPTRVRDPESERLANPWTNALQRTVQAHRANYPLVVGMLLFWVSLGSGLPSTIPVLTYVDLQLLGMATFVGLITVYIVGQLVLDLIGDRRAWPGVGGEETSLPEATTAPSITSRDPVPYQPQATVPNTSGFGRYAVALPAALLLLLLIIPAVSASVLSPHGPADRDLTSTLLPPVWVGDQVLTKEIVQRVENDETEVSINNLRHLLASGAGELEDRNGNGEADLGEALVQAVPGGSWEFPLGTDRVGRDVLSRLMYGARWTMTVSLGSLLLAAAIGVPLGFSAATRGGRLDAFIRNLVHIYLLFPSVVLMMLVLAGFGGGTVAATFAIFMWMWPRFAQLTREKTLAARRRNISLLPHIAKGCVALAALNLGLVILLVTALSLAASVPHPPAPAWGRMVIEAREFILRGWWLALFPAVVISVVVLSANALGEWVRNRLDPAQRQV